MNGTSRRRRTVRELGKFSQRGMGCYAAAGSSPEPGDGAPAEAAAGHAGTVDAIDGKRGIDQEIEFRTAHFVVVLQAAVGFHHEAAHAGKVAAATGIDEIGYARVFGND